MSQHHALSLQLNKIPVCTTSNPIQISPTHSSPNSIILFLRHPPSFKKSHPLNPRSAAPRPPVWVIYSSMANLPVATSKEKWRCLLQEPSRASSSSAGSRTSWTLPSLRCWNFDGSDLCGSFAGNHSYCELMSAVSRRQKFTAFLPIHGSPILSNPSSSIFPEPEEELIRMCRLGLRTLIHLFINSKIQSFKCGIILSVKRHKQAQLSTGINLLLCLFVSLLLPSLTLSWRDDFEVTMLSELSQPWNDKWHVFPLMWSLH